MIIATHICLACLRRSIHGWVMPSWHPQCCANVCMQFCEEPQIMALLCVCQEARMPAGRGQHTRVRRPVQPPPTAWPGGLLEEARSFETGLSLLPDEVLLSAESPRSSILVPEVRGFIGMAVPASSNAAVHTCAGMSAARYPCNACATGQDCHAHRCMGIQ